jgi:hypothetical protein
MKRHKMVPGHYWFKGTVSWRGQSDGYEFGTLAHKDGVVVLATSCGQFLLPGSSMHYAGDALDGIFVGPLLLPDAWVDCRTPTFEQQYMQKPVPVPSDPPCKQCGIRATCEGCGTQIETNDRAFAHDGKVLCVACYSELGDA